MVSHEPAKFGRHGHCDSGYVKVLVCHLILQDCWTKGKLYGQETLKVNHYPNRFGSHRHSGKTIGNLARPRD